MKNRKIGAKILAACIAATMLTAAIPAQAATPAASAMDMQSRTGISGPMGWQIGTGSSIYWAGATEWQLADGLKAYVNHYSGNLAFQFKDGGLEFTWNAQDDIGDPLSLANNLVCNYAQQLDVQDAQNPILSSTDGSKFYFKDGKFGPYGLIDIADGGKYQMGYRDGVNYSHTFDEQGREVTKHSNSPENRWLMLSEVKYFNPGDPDASYYDSGIKSIWTADAFYTFDRYARNNKQYTTVTDEKDFKNEYMFGITKNATTGELEHVAGKYFTWDAYDAANGTYTIQSRNGMGYFRFTTVNVDGAERISSVVYSPDGTDANAKRTQFTYGNNMTVIVNNDGSVQIVNFDENGSPIA